MSNSIAYAKNYTGILDEVYQRASVSSCLNSGRKMVRAGRNAKEIMIPKISVTGLGDYTRNTGYQTGSITYEYETRTFNYDRGIKLLADVMDVEESGVLDCFVEAGSELQRTQVGPEADAFTFWKIASHTGVTVHEDNFSSSSAADILAALRTVTNLMDEKQVSTGSRYLFITPTLKGILDDFSLANPNRSNRVLERFAKIIEVPQVRFYTKIVLNSGSSEQFGYSKASDGKDINFMVVEKSAVIKYDKHIASRVFSPDELENLDSYMMKYRKYGIVELFDNKLDGVYVSAKPLPTYTVTFNAGDGTVTPTSGTTGTDGKLTSLPTPTPPSGKTFSKWATAASGGTQVTTSTVFTANTTIYAQYTDSE